MTLNRGDKVRCLDKRRGSMPFSAHQHLHRRSMPVDERDLRAALPQGELSGLVRCTSYSPGEEHRESWASDSSDSVISSGSDSDSHLYKVILLGEHGVGKTSLARIFGGVEDGAEAEEAEGRACAVVFDCKFIETSAALHHNVKDLFEGIVRQIRLRKDSKEDNARRMANTKRRESIGKKAKRFLGRIVAKNNKKMAFKAKSKSCHDLSVL
ncbi:hypothetical protein llap_13867 [Limosa lapponica baueri]|uniref:Uncharacterized protein n=1 Tax=Limosa lapponica baueri TaxID=1758121 RepID=A0A2I0TPT1_LIMLA|nr:hypothetical protein llap_13867 [Limosa lapponica baueri]